MNRILLLVTLVLASCCPDTNKEPTPPPVYQRDTYSYQNPTTPPVCRGATYWYQNIRMKIKCTVNEMHSQPKDTENEIIITNSNDHEIGIREISFGEEHEKEKKYFRVQPRTQRKRHYFNNSLFKRVFVVYDNLGLEIAFIDTHSWSKGELPND